MAILLYYEKQITAPPSNEKDIIKDIYKVRYENKKFVLYDWDFKKSNIKFNYDSFLNLFKEFFESDHQWDDSWNLPDSEEKWNNECKERLDSGNVWVTCDSDGTVKGFITLSRDNKRIIIHELAVSSKYKGNGYGKKLMEFAEVLAADAKCNQTCVEVYEKNKVAKSLYEKLGYRMVYSKKSGNDSHLSTESLMYSIESANQIKRTGKYTYNNKKKVGGRRRFKCLDCGQRFHEFMQLYNHAEKFHKDLIGDQDVYRYLYEKRNPGPYICPICNKNPREWNDKNHKYRRICSAPDCKKKARELYSKNMKRVYGTDNLLTDPARQEEMLKNRSISGIYTFQDGVQISYVGEYERDFIMHCIEKFGYGSTDLMNCPRKYYLEYYDPYTEKNRFYMPDFYIPKYNLVIEIKDGSKYPIDSKAKAKLKEKAVVDSKLFNYVKIVEKVYTDFDSVIDMFNNDAYAENHFDKDFVIVIPEDTSK